MWAKMAIISTPSAAIRVQSSGMLKASPACTVSFAARPIIQPPETNTTSTATNTARKKRRSAACISGMRCGGGNCIAAGRRKKWANTMPPTQTTMDSTCSSLRVA